MGRRATALAATIGLLALVGLALLYREALSHGFSAREKPWAIEAFVARRLRGLATGFGAASMHNPITPSAAVLAEARDHFADHCATCHGNDGGGQTAINEGLYPPAPDLREEATQELTDGQLLLIIRNGIRFTGMPGWGGTDQENWQLVLFIRHLPSLSEEELELMREVNPEDPAPAGSGHHRHDAG